MKAIQMTQYGGPEVLKIADLAIQSPGHNQALVRIKRAGVNFIDIYQRRGAYPVDLPYVPGLEASGVVEAVGKGVKNVKQGDRVAYVHDPGAYAQYALVDAERLIALPDQPSFDQGAEE